jgi:uncharacterized RDD family membrane protein YckC
MDEINGAIHNDIYHDDYRIVGGFWKRILAFIIDGIILGFAGSVIGLLFYDQLASLGKWGSVLGFFLALPYFCLLNSAIGNGQTIGKKIVKIEVIDRDGKHISVIRSLVRYIILGLPYFLGGTIISAFYTTTLLGQLIGFIVFGFWGIILYLYIFNRHTRQSLHDLLVGTYVVKTIPKGSVHFEPIWKPHLIIGWFFFIVVYISALTLGNVFLKGALHEILSLQHSIQSTGDVQETIISSSFPSQTKNSFIRINAIWNNKPQDFEVAANKIAVIVMRDYPDVMSKDNLIININYGYNIGIASVWKSKTFKHSPQEWKTALQSLPEKKEK